MANEAEAKIRKFETGATRDTDVSKYDYEGFLSPAVLERFGAYMHKHRVQANGELRDSGNWQRGIPKDAYMKSLIRHVFALWRTHRNVPEVENIEDSLCAIMFNAMGYLFEEIRTKNAVIAKDMPQVPNTKTTMSPLQ